MSQSTLFKYRHFEAKIILLCLRWYLRYSLSYRDLEEMMAERCLPVVHTTIPFDTAWRTLQGYEATNQLRKGQVKGSTRVDINSQVRFVEKAFGLTA